MKEDFNKEKYVGKIEFLRIAIFGHYGVGKSSFVNTCKKSVNKTMNAYERSGKEGTYSIEDYLLTDKIRLFDTRGFFQEDDIEVSEFEAIINSVIKPSTAITRQDISKLQKASIEDRIHAVIFAFKAGDPRLDNDSYNYSKYYEILKGFGMIPVSIVTHADLAKKDYKSIISRLTGTPPESIFILKNTTDKNKSAHDYFYETEALNAIKAACHSAEKHIKTDRQRNSTK